MDAEKKVSAETYRERDLPPVIPLSGITAFLSLVLAVLTGMCGAMPFFERQTALWFTLAMSVLSIVGIVALAVLLVSGCRYYGWRYGLFRVPPKHTLKVQFMRLLSDMSYIPNDTTKWKSRRVKVRTELSDLRARIVFVGGLMKDIETLGVDLMERCYLEGVRAVTVTQAFMLDGNDGWQIDLDYMNPKRRAEIQDAMDRGEW